MYTRPPIADEIAALRSELARTSLQRPGHRRYLEQRLRVLESARDAWAEKTSEDAREGGGALGIVECAASLRTFTSVATSRRAEASAAPGNSSVCVPRAGDSLIGGGPEEPISLTEARRSASGVSDCLTDVARERDASRAPGVTGGVSSRVTDELRAFASKQAARVSGAR